MDPPPNGRLGDALPSPDERIQVMVRLRPPLGEEEEAPGAIQIQGNRVSVTAPVRGRDDDKVMQCDFESVFDAAHTQADVYAAIRPAILNVMAGMNTTVFAYGQTGSGKTHTMLGEGIESALLREDTDESAHQDSLHPKLGVIPRSMHDLFIAVDAEARRGSKVTAKCSYLQIYNNKLFDLLEDGGLQASLHMRETVVVNGSINVFVAGLSIKTVTSVQDVMKLLGKGSRNRTVRSTDFNQQSSRSHAILQMSITVETEETLRRDGRGKGADEEAEERTSRPTTSTPITVVRRAKLNLVDLAGSEKYVSDSRALRTRESRTRERTPARRTREGGTRGGTREGLRSNRSLSRMHSKIYQTTDEAEQQQYARELQTINSSLSALGNCIAALTEAKRTHIPYRDSPLTRLLQDSLGGNTRTIVLATISSAAMTVNESYNTLLFASRARKVTVSVSANVEKSTADALKEALSEIARLKRQVQKLKDTGSPLTSPGKMELQAPGMGPGMDLGIASPMAMGKGGMGMGIGKGKGGGWYGYGGYGHGSPTKGGKGKGKGSPGGWGGYHYNPYGMPPSEWAYYHGAGKGDGWGKGGGAGKGHGWGGKGAGAGAGTYEWWDSGWQMDAYGHWHQTHSPGKKKGKKGGAKGGKGARKQPNAGRDVPPIALEGALPASKGKNAIESPPPSQQQISPSGREQARSPTTIHTPPSNLRKLESSIPPIVPKSNPNDQFPIPISTPSHPPPDPIDPLSVSPPPPHVRNVGLDASPESRTNRTTKVSVSGPGAGPGARAGAGAGAQGTGHGRVGTLLKKDGHMKDRGSAFDAPVGGGGGRGARRENKASTGQERGADRAAAAVGASAAAPRAVDGGGRGPRRRKNDNLSPVDEVRMKGGDEVVVTPRSVLQHDGLDDVRDGAKIPIVITPTGSPKPKIRQSDADFEEVEEEERRRKERDDLDREERELEREERELEREERERAARRRMGATEELDRLRASAEKEHQRAKENADAVTSPKRERRLQKEQQLQGEEEERERRRIKRIQSTEALEEVSSEAIAVSSSDEDDDDFTSAAQAQAHREREEREREERQERERQQQAEAEAEARAQARRIERQFEDEVESGDAGASTSTGADNFADADRVDGSNGNLRSKAEEEVRREMAEEKERREREMANREERARESRLREREMIRREVEEAEALVGGGSKRKAPPKPKSGTAKAASAATAHGPDSPSVATVSTTSLPFDSITALSAPYVPPPQPPPQPPQSTAAARASSSSSSPPPPASTSPSWSTGREQRHPIKKPDMSYERWRIDKANRRSDELFEEAKKAIAAISASPSTSPTNDAPLPSSSTSPDWRQQQESEKRTRSYEYRQPKQTSASMSASSSSAIGSGTRGGGSGVSSSAAALTTTGVCAKHEIYGCVLCGSAPLGAAASNATARRLFSQSQPGAIGALAPDALQIPGGRSKPQQQQQQQQQHSSGVNRSKSNRLRRPSNTKSPSPRRRSGGGGGGGGGSGSGGRSARDRARDRGRDREKESTSRSPPPNREQQRQRQRQRTSPKWNPAAANAELNAMRDRANRQQQEELSATLGSVGGGAGGGRGGGWGTSGGESPKACAKHQLVSCILCAEAQTLKPSRAYAAAASTSTSTRGRARGRASSNDSQSSTGGGKKSSPPPDRRRQRQMQQMQSRHESGHTAGSPSSSRSPPLHHQRLAELQRERERERKAREAAERQSRVTFLSDSDEDDAAGAGHAAGAGPSAAHSSNDSGGGGGGAGSGRRGMDGGGDERAPSSGEKIRNKKKEPLGSKQQQGEVARMKRIYGHGSGNSPQRTPSKGGKTSPSPDGLDKDRKHGHRRMRT